MTHLIDVQARQLYMTYLQLFGLLAATILPFRNQEASHYRQENNGQSPRLPSRIRIGSMQTADTHRGMIARKAITKTTVSSTLAKCSAQLTGMKTRRTLSQLALTTAIILCRQVGSFETVEDEHCISELLNNMGCLQTYSSVAVQTDPV